MLNKRNLISNLTLNLRAIALVWLVLVALFVAMLGKQWLYSEHAPIETNILKLLPKNQQNPVAEQAFETVSNSMSDKIVFLLTAQEEDSLFSAATELTTALQGTQLFDQVTGKISAEQQKQWAAYYFEHRYQQLTPEQRQRLTNTPQEQVQLVVQSIYNPFSGVTGQELKNDPFLLFRDYLAQVSAQNSAFTLKNGFLTTHFQGQEYVLVTASLTDSPYSLAAQQGVADIKQIEQQIEETFQATIYHTGVLFYAEFGTESAKSEISTIGLFSLLGVIGLFVIVFRSVTPLALALLSISIGLLAALAVTTWLFGRVHLFSLVFGASLIGVSIDYAFHYLTERLAEGEQWDSRKGLSHIFAAITMGLATSLIGYLGMLIAPFPGLQQLALFSSIGLIAAYITVVAWYPILAKKTSPSRPLPGESLWRWWLNVWSKPTYRIALPIICLVATAYPLSQLRYDDDIRQLQAMPDSLKQQEQRISEVSGLKSSQQMLVVTAHDDESLMQKLEAIAPQLDKWQQQGVIKQYQSLNQFLSSELMQQQDFTLIAQLYKTQAKTLAASLGLVETPDFAAEFSPISLQAYLANPVSEPIRFLYIGQFDDSVASVIVLTELSNPELVVSWAQENNNISYLNKAQEISLLFAKYRTHVMELLALAITIISALLIKRYGLQHAIRIVLPSLIACIAGLAAASALGSTLNLFNLLALILIIGIGIDYTLFFAEKSRSHSTLLAITLSAITTLLSFGLLALSDTHAIHSFGITVLSGIFVAWLLSPLAINLKDETQ
ncbi:MMPL family transporter [Vibrio sinaloensis]|uniref:Membrane protein n=1 Tax=Photobacterium sp. (strain ATCC 43367) TaxID=379097 RepID=A0A0A5I1W5_PHOS4|nr:MMPL family transporter [Vibrio sinaloensis]KGY09796.1 membrane protein [Vibrio sinaloensis]